MKPDNPRQTWNRTNNQQKPIRNYYKPYALKVQQIQSKGSAEALTANVKSISKQTKNADIVQRATGVMSVPNSRR